MWLLRLQMLKLYSFHSAVWFSTATNIINMTQPILPFYFSALLHKFRKRLPSVQFLPSDLYRTISAWM